MSQVAALRALIEQRFPDATPAVRRTAALVATGVPALDVLLPAGGFPLGKLTACRPGGGMTAILRAAAAHVAGGQGERAAWVDGAGTVAGAMWDDGPVLLRPRTPQGALAAADELLRSGGFRLVVLTTEDALRDAVLVRLVRAAHAGGGAFAALTPCATMAALRLHARIAPDAWRWRADPAGEPGACHAVRVRVDAQALGWHRRAEVVLPVREDALRLALTPGLADRRGVGRPPRPARGRLFAGGR